ncbi:MAG: hypothetical protein HY735_35370, partial [Verrucomicrobia bacterium]|nr:hypothetical protein [Verrucomicrobiota bacterium]
MLAFQRLSIRDKLRLMMMLTCIAALVLSTTVIVGFGVIRQRQDVEQRLAQVAALTAFSAWPFLEVNAQQECQTVLSSLSETPGIVIGAIYGTNGQAFATYVRPKSPLAPPSKPPPAGFSISSLSSLEFVHLIRNAESQEIGVLYLRSDAAKEWQLLRLFLAVVCSSFLLASVAAWWLSNRSQRVFVAPILQLLQTAKTVSLRKEYGLRAQRVADDELGQLVNGFNEMLEQIDARDKKLQKHREELEEQVLKRTEELTSLNEDLQLAKERADEANEAKSMFLANMSHEIRTPLNAILGFSDLLNGVLKEPKERSYVAAISSSGKSLLTIINDILDLSKIEAGRLELQYEPVSVRQLLTEVAQVFSQKAEEKGLKLEINVAKEMPEGLLLDEVRLRQILFNVIGNAVKFTEKGTIRISAASKAWEADESQVDLLLHVADSGVGIPAGELDRIFDTFTQVSGQSTRKYGGTGLGLA